MINVPTNDAEINRVAARAREIALKGATPEQVVAPLQLWVQSIRSYGFIQTAMKQLAVEDKIVPSIPVTYGPPSKKKRVTRKRRRKAKR
jgi:hypothetical protein